MNDTKEDSRLMRILLSSSRWDTRRLSRRYKKSTIKEGNVICRRARKTNAERKNERQKKRERQTKDERRSISRELFSPSFSPSSFTFFFHRAFSSLLSVSPWTFSLAHGFHPFRRSHFTAITERCCKPAIVILAVYCASRFSCSREETIISDRVHCVHCIIQSRPVTDDRVRLLTPACTRGC
jgi:hypothetical protein